MSVFLVLPKQSQLEKVAIRGGDKSKRPEYVSLQDGYRQPSSLLLLSSSQETLMKVSSWLTEQKKDVRFGHWNAVEVSWCDHMT